MIKYEFVQGNLILWSDVAGCFSFLPELEEVRGVQDSLWSSDLRLYFKHWRTIPSYFEQWVPFVMENLGVKHLVREKDGLEVLSKGYMTFDLSKTSGPALVTAWNFLRTCDNSERMGASTMWQYIREELRPKIIGKPEVGMLANWMFSQIFFRLIGETGFHYSPMIGHSSLSSNHYWNQIPKLASWRKRGARFRPIREDRTYEGGYYVAFDSISTYGESIQTTWKTLERSEPDHTIRAQKMYSYFFQHARRVMAYLEINGG